MRFLALLFAVAAVSGVTEPPLRQPAATLGQESQVSAELGGMTIAAATKPIGLNPGAGRMHQRVSTDSERAQAYYDQGIAYPYSYVWVDAARSFHEALRLDGELAMARVGLGKTYFNAEAWEAARAEFARASVLAEQGNATEKEVLWISLAQQQMDTSYAPRDQLAAQQAEYKAALDALIQFDPDDAHAWVLRGNAEEARRWGRGQRGRVGSIAYYESALQRNPDHFGAHHFLVHSYENIWHYGKAAEHGARLVDLAPDVPHAHHMYAHVLPRLGRWDEALRHLSIADRLHREYFAREGIAPGEDWHYPHNLTLLGTVQQRMGAVDETDRLYKELFETPNNFFSWSGAETGLAEPIDPREAL